MTVLLQGVVGSTAYGLNTSESDIDLLGTYAGSTSDVLTFGIPAESQTVVTRKPDITCHEVGKFATLALRCNPAVLELLWLEQYTIETDAGRRLRELAPDFLSGPAVRGRYCNYAVDQAIRLLRRDHRFREGLGAEGRVAKPGRHCARLLIQCEQLLSDGFLTVRLTADEVARVWEMGERAAKDAEAFSREMVNEAERVRALPSVLPELPRRDRIVEWLVDVRLAELAHEMAGHG